MESTRREVVGLLASGLLAGCTGAGVPSVQNPLGGNEARTPARGTTTPTETPGTSATTTGTNVTPTSTRDESGGATGRVFDEVAWFATRCGVETERFRSLSARTRNFADLLSRRSSVDREAVARLERLAGRVETVAYDRLAPHFDASPTIRSFNRERFDRIETLRSRGDWDAVGETLATVADRYATYASEEYVARTFPRDPVRGPLARYAIDADHAGDVVLLAYHLGSGEEVRIQHSSDDYAGTPPGGRADVERYRTLFGPLAADEGGEAAAYVTVTSLIGGGSLPLSIRRYRDADAADAAAERLLDGGLTAERTVRPDGQEWRRVFYRSEGDVMYAEMTRVGPFLVGAAPGRAPWEDRSPGWRLPMELIWLGGVN